jgi:hypothetical protein
MMVARWLMSAPRRPRPMKTPRRRRDRNIAIEILEDRLAPVVGATQAGTPVVLGPTDPLTAAGSSSGGIVQILTPGGGSLGTGELLSTGRDILTAAHIVTNSNGVVIPGIFTITFQLPAATMMTVPSTAITVNPGWNGNPAHGSDLAIIALPTPAPAAAARYPLYTGNNEVNQTYNLEGYGQTGTGALGSTSPGWVTSSGTLRSGNNTWDGTDQIFSMPQANPFPANLMLAPGFPANSALVSDFDDGTAAHDALGFYFGVVGLGVPNESIAAPGDSGGPEFLGNAVAGVVSYLIGPPTNPPDILPGANSSFGDIEVDTRVSAFAGWINSVINVNRLQVSLPATVTAGVPFSITVTAVNAFGNVIPGYRGTVSFSTSDVNPGISLPANYPFVAADNGRHVFPVAGAVTTLITSGTQFITATDTTSPTFRGYGSTTVVAAATSQLLVVPFSQTTVTPLPAIAGVIPRTLGPAGTGQPLTFVVLAADEFGNVTPNYRGTVMFTSSDAAATLPPPYMFTPADKGVHAFTGKPGQTPTITYNTVGDQTLRAVDTVVAGISGRVNIRLVDSTTAVALRITVPPQVTAGLAFSVTAQAVNAFGGVATGYRGTIRFVTSDPNPAVVPPPNYPFVPGDNGVHTFTNAVTLRTAGSVTIGIIDTVNPTLRTSGTTNVNPAATAALVLVPASANVVTNLPFGVTVRAIDAFGNTTPNYRGTIRFTSSDVGAGVILPANYPFAPADNGVHTFPDAVSLVTAGARTVTATDTAVAAITGTGNVTVGAPVLSRLRVVTSVNTTTAGVAFSVTVTAQDALRSTITNYEGTIRFTSSDPNVAMRMLPANYKFMPGDRGVHTFNGVVLATSGLQTITATDTVMAAVLGSASVTVNPALASRLVVTPAAGPAGMVLLGVPAAFTVTARDRFGNIATGYRGIVQITSNDGMATLPMNTMFTASDQGVHTFFGSSAIIFGTAGARTITATDAAARINGTGNVTVVAPAAAVTLSVQILGLAPSTVSGLSAVQFNQPFSVTVSALDANGFVTPSYTGTIMFASSDNAAGVVLPANAKFTPADLGTMTFTGLKLITRGRVATISATDTMNGRITGSGRVAVL